MPERGMGDGGKGAVIPGVAGNLACGSGTYLCTVDSTGNLSRLPSTSF